MSSSKNQNTETSSDDEFTLELNNLATLQEYISSYSSGAGIIDISVYDIHNMLRNPYIYIKRIQRTARYLSNRFGIIKDVNEAFKTLPTLNYHLVWSNYDNPSKIKKYEKKVYDLLDSINVKKVVRDGLGEEAEIGTVVCVNRNGKYIQFLDIDQVVIRKQVNGRWIPEIDLLQISGTFQEIIDCVNSLPEEVTIQKYNLYKSKNIEENRFIELKNAYVLSHRGTRNFPYGFPYSLSAWNAFFHKALIEQVEKSVADRKIKALLVLYVNSIAKKEEGFKPPKKEVIDNYFRELSLLLKRKDHKRTGNDTVGTGVMTLPSFFDLKEIQLDTEMFPKDVYEQLDRSIFSSLGVSESLIYGGGSSKSNFATAQMNSDKFFRYIFAALEDWEYMINDIIKSVLPADLDCRFYFDRTTIGDREQDIQAKKDFFMQTNIWIPYAESVLGVPYSYALGLAEYQEKVLKIDKLIHPAANAFTQSGNPSDNKGGRPESKNPTNENTIKSKSNGANKLPSPSD